MACLIPAPHPAHAPPSVWLKETYMSNQSPLRVALVSPYDYPYPGGVTEHISYLEKHLRALGHLVKIIAPSSTAPADLESHIIQVGDTIVQVPFSGSIARVTLSPRLFPRMSRFFEREQFDIVHVHEPTIPALSLAVLYGSQSVNIGTFHAYRENINTSYEIGRPILRYFLSRLHGRIAVSQATAEYIASYFPGTYRVIPNGIEVERFADPTILPIERFSDDNKFNILFVGRLERRKGFRYLLRAFRQVKSVLPQARLLVVGAYEKADRAPFVRYVRHFGLRDVKFIGYVSPEELPRWYHTAHIFCAPSTGYESFGIVLLEAMASGVPIVASDIAGYRSVLTSGVDGELVPPENEEALAEALIRLATDHARRLAYIAAGRLKANRYRWSTVAQEVADFYYETIETVRHPRSPQPLFSIGV
jgi:phosphatidylinositol alpha-mannosyltransferase